MSKTFLFLLVLFCCTAVTGNAQGHLSIEKVHATYLRNSGTIMENNQIKGYFFLYQSDKIDKRTNEYTLQILDQNLNKVIDIRFEDSKKISLLEAAYNNSSLAFLFKNDDTKTLDLKIYGINGKLKYTYSRMFDKRSDDLMKAYATLHTDEGTNQNVFDLGEKGYASVLPVRDGKQRSYEVDYYSSVSKKQWTYIPDDEEKFAAAEFLGSTDSLIILEVMKRKSALSKKVSSHIVGINFVTRKKAFDISEEESGYVLVPASIEAIKGTDRLLVLGNYFETGDKIMNEYSTGLAVYEITTSGKVVSRAYNSWAGDFAEYLPTNRKGKISNIGYLYVHRVIQAPGGKLFVVGEGYKRQASAGGIALTALGALGGNYGSAGVTKIVVTDLVMMEFNNEYKIKGATVFDKTNNTAVAGSMSDYNSQHTLAMYLKTIGAFDYAFTTGDSDNANFVVCFSDWVRSSEYRGQTFNSIRFNGEKFITDKIELKSKASKMRVFPAKAGSVMILEYFKKDKRLDLRIEKLG